MTLLGDFLLGLFLSGPETSAERWSPRARVAFGAVMTVVCVASITAMLVYVIVAWN